MLNRPRLSRRPITRRPFLESRTEVWRELGLGGEIDRQQAHRAQRDVVLIVLLIVGVMILFRQRADLFPGFEKPVKFATVAALVILGWALARSLGRGLAPTLMRRLDPAMAGTIGFLIRLVTIVLVVIVALRVAGLNASTLAVGGAFTAVVVGLAAQQTLSNLFAGLVILSTRPFRVGERVRLVGGALAGQVEGILGSLGLFYTTLVSGADRILVPNSMVLNVAVIPLREPERVELRARFKAQTTPAEVQELLREAISVPMRYPPHVALEEVERDQVMVRIAATPERSADGAKLASEILAAVRDSGGNGGERLGD